jgi:hypothetical protein
MIFMHFNFKGSFNPHRTKTMSSKSRDYVRCDDCAITRRKDVASVGRCHDCWKPICKNCVADEDDNGNLWCETCHYEYFREDSN